MNEKKEPVHLLTFELVKINEHQGIILTIFATGQEQINTFTIFPSGKIMLDHKFSETTETAMKTAIKKYITENFN